MSRSAMMRAMRAESFPAGARVMFFGPYGVSADRILQKVQHWTRGGHRPMALVRWLWQRLVPMCPGVILDRATSKSRVAHPWSWDIGSSTSAAQTSLNMVLSRRKARPFALSSKSGLQENGRPSPTGTALWPGPCSMG